MEPRKNPFRLFSRQVFFVLATLFLAILTGYRIREGVSPELESLTSQEISLWYFVVAFFILTLLLIFLLKIMKGAFIFDFLFTLAMASGIFIVAGQFFPLMLSAFITAGFIILNAFLAKVYFHNIIITLGIAGIAANLGLSVSITSALIILALLSLYDIIAVYKTKHMVTLFTRLVERGVILSLIVPFQAKDLNHTIKGIKPGDNFMFLGTGDLAFPALFAVAALSENIISSIMISIGALIGIFIIQVLYSLQKEKKAMPALPPIALFSLLGYLFSYLFL